MTNPRRPGRPLRSLTRVGAWLLAVLAAVGLLVLSAGTASAHTRPDAGNRVRASTPQTITAVGVSEHITAGQGRGPPVLRGQFVVATGVAADAAPKSQVFWSGGIVAKSAAEDYARTNGGTTLEMTAHGQGAGLFVRSPPGMVGYG